MIKANWRNRMLNPNIDEMLLSQGREASQSANVGEGRGGSNMGVIEALEFEAGGFGIEIEMFLVLHCSVNGSFGNDV
jgi:hypothetical protein